MVVDLERNGGGGTLDERVRDARRSLTRGVEPEMPDVAQVRARARRQRLAGTAAAVIVAVVAVVAVGILRTAQDAPSPVIAGEPEFRQPGTHNARLLDLGESKVMAPSPLEGRSTMASVWTGHEMIVWGGEAEGRFFADGAAYDPVADSWRMLAPSPLSARNAPAAVWTGDEMFLWGGHGSGGVGQRDGAAYDPTTDTWRPISEAPITSAGLPQAVWTGEEMLVVAGFNNVAAAAYDPDSDTWRTMPPVPGQPLGNEMRAIWTGQEMVLRAEYRNASPSAGRVGGLFAYDPDSDRWNELPGTGHDDAYLTNLAFTGEHLLRVTQKPGALVTRYDSDTRTWTGIAHWPDDKKPMGTSAWTGDQLLLWGGGEDALLVDPDTGTLTSTPADGGPGGSYPAAVWADGIMLIWGGSENVDEGILLRPVASPPSATGTTITIPRDTEPRPQGEPVPVAGPDGAVGFLDPTPGPVEVNGRLLPVQRVLDEDGNLIGYFACTFLPRDVVEDPDFDPDTLCSTVTTMQHGR